MVLLAISHKCMCTLTHDRRVCTEAHIVGWSEAENMYIRSHDIVLVLYLVLLYDINLFLFSPFIMRSACSIFSPFIQHMALFYI